MAIHRGSPTVLLSCLIADLPGNYLNWFARIGFAPGEIGRLLALMQEINHNGLKPLLDPIRARVSIVPKRPTL